MGYTPLGSNVATALAAAANFTGGFLTYDGTAGALNVVTSIKSTTDNVAVLGGTTNQFNSLYLGSSLWFWGGSARLYANGSGSLAFSATSVSFSASTYFYSAAYFSTYINLGSVAASSNQGMLWNDSSQLGLATYVGGSNVGARAMLSSTLFSMASPASIYGQTSLLEQDFVGQQVVATNSGATWTFAYPTAINIGDEVRLKVSSGGSLPSGFSEYNTYFVIGTGYAPNTACRLASSLVGPAITGSGGSGTFTIIKAGDIGTMTIPAGVMVKGKRLRLSAGGNLYLGTPGSVYPRLWLGGVCLGHLDNTPSFSLGSLTLYQFSYIADIYMVSSTCAAVEGKFLVASSQGSTNNCFDFSTRASTHSTIGQTVTFANVAPNTTPITGYVASFSGTTGDMVEFISGSSATYPSGAWPNGIYSKVPYYITSGTPGGATNYMRFSLSGGGQEISGSGVGAGTNYINLVGRAVPVTGDCAIRPTLRFTSSSILHYINTSHCVLELLD